LGRLFAFEAERELALIVFDESSEAFEHFYREIANALRPEGAMEIQLTEWVAINAWRLRRVYRVKEGERLGLPGTKQSPNPHVP
jgi:hypothetical protein